MGQIPHWYKKTAIFRYEAHCVAVSHFDIFQAKSLQFLRKLLDFQMTSNNTIATSLSLFDNGWTRVGSCGRRTQCEGSSTGSTSNCSGLGNQGCFGQSERMTRKVILFLLEILKHPSHDAESTSVQERVKAFLWSSNLSICSGSKWIRARHKI